MHIQLLDIIPYRQNRENHTAARPFYALSFRLEGEGKLSTGETTYNAKRDDLIFVPHNIAYHHIGYKEELIAFHFNIYDASFQNIVLCRPNEPNRYRHLFVTALQLWQSKDAGYHYEALSLLYRIFAEMEKDGLLHLAESDPEMAQCREFIRAHCTERDLSVSALAKRHHMSETYLRRRFQKFVGVSPKRFINSERLERAVLLLLSGNRTHCEIAQECGYRDVKYFRQAFRIHFGKTITQFLHEKRQK